jgi:sec-independent protein translocase protein TatA
MNPRSCKLFPVPDIGPTAILLLLVVGLLLFGSERLPEIGRSIGEGMREFRESVRGDSPSGGSDAAPSEFDMATAASDPAPERPEREPHA